jgi:hypothetical protein
MSISGNILPLYDISCDLGSITKPWSYIYVNDLSIVKINGQAYSAVSNLTSVSGSIIPSLDNNFKLGDVSKNWSNAYIKDISVTNISVSGNILPLRGISCDLGSITNMWRYIYVNDLSVARINGQATNLTSVSTNIVPSTSNRGNLGSSITNITKIFELNSDEKTWVQHRDQALSLGKTLAVISNVSENNQVGTAAGANAVWIGGLRVSNQDPALKNTGNYTDYKEPVFTYQGRTSVDWQWVTGEPWIYQNFESGAPEDLRELYPLFFGYYNNLWNDRDGVVPYMAVYMTTVETTIDSRPWDNAYITNIDASNININTINGEAYNRSITLNFPTSSLTSIKKSVILPSPVTLTKSNIIAQIDNVAKNQQVYTFGRSIPNLWVAVGGGTYTIAYSNNGITWTGVQDSSTNIFTTRGNGVAYNGSIWVAVGEGTNTVAYSYDGIIWNGLGNIIFTTRGNGIAYNGTIWVAVGEGTNSIAYSFNAMNWIGIANSNNTFTTRGNGIAWNGNMWVAVGYGTNAISYSYDGSTNWNGIAHSARTFSIGGLVGGKSIAWNGTMWLAVGYGINYFTYSYDGIIWNPIISNLVDNGSTGGGGIAWNGTIWVAAPVGEGRAGLMYSYDGKIWIDVIWYKTDLVEYKFLSGYDIAWNGTIWVAVGYGITAFGYSYDGIHWTGITNGATIFSLGSTGGGRSVAYNSHRPNRIVFPSNLTVAVGSGTNKIAYSSDGITWTNSSNGSSIFTTGNHVSWNGAMWVAVGTGATHRIAYSYNGINWNAVSGSVNIFSTGYAVAFSENMWVAVGAGTNFKIACSYDGIIWQGVSGSSTIFTTGWGVAYNGTNWVAVGQGSCSIAISSNGINWDPVPNSNNIFTIGLGVAWNGAMWVAVGEGTYTIAYSFNGFQWTGITINSSTNFQTRGNGIAWNGTMWVAVGQGGNCIAYSYNGRVWFSASPNSISGVFSTAGYDIAWNGTRWLAVGAGTNSMAFSYNGIKWQGVSGSSTTFSSGGNGIAWNAGIGCVLMNYITLNKYGIGLSNKLDIVCDNYYNQDYSNFTLTIKY